MKPDPKTEQRLVYATPTPPQTGSSPNIPIPYVLFGTCTLILMIGLVILTMNPIHALGPEAGLVIVVPAAIGAIVLPIVSQMREK